MNMQLTFYRSATAAFAVMTLMTFTVPARAGLINGGFELTPGQTSRFVVPAVSPIPSLTGWSLGQAPGTEISCVVVMGVPSPATSPGACQLWSGAGTTVVGPSTATTDSPSPAGGNYFFMDGDPNNASLLSQTLTDLTPNSNYDVTFWQSAAQETFLVGGSTVCGSPTTTDRWLVSFTGNPDQLSPLMCNASKGFYGWESVTLTFSTGPTMTSAVLGFIAVGTPGGQPPVALLDGISVTQVPEPPAWALVGFALASIAVARRRQNRGS